MHSARALITPDWSLHNREQKATAEGASHAAHTTAVILLNIAEREVSTGEGYEEK